MPTTLRLLVVEDSASDAELMLRQLRKDGFALEAVRVEDEESFRHQLSQQQWHAIVCDYRLPNFSAPAALRMLQAASRDIPFIVLSGAVGENAAVAIMRDGAQDFIAKENLWQLGPAITRELREAASRADHRRAVRMLRTSERHYRSLVENINQGFYVSDRRGIITYASAAVSLVSGHSEEELVNQIAYRLVHPDDRAHVIASYTAWAKTEVADTRIEFRILPKDRGEIWVEQHTHYVRDIDGNVIKYRNLVNDITERRAAEKAMRDSEERYRSLIESSADGILLVDLSGVIHSANKMACQLHGWEHDELVGMNVRALATDATANDTADLLAKCPLREAQTLETLHRHSAGAEIPVEIVATSIQNQGEHFVLLAVRDITERLVQEEERRRLTLLVRESGNSVVISDAEGRVEWVNSGFVELTGYKLEEVRGRVPGSFLQGPRTDPEVVAQMRESMAKHEVVKTELLNYHKSGRPFWTYVSIQPMLDHRGNLTGYFSTSSDITEHKMSAESLEFLALRPTRSSEGDYFNRVAAKLADVLQVDAAFVMAFTDEQRDRLRVLGGWTSRKDYAIGPEEMNTAGRPCAALATEEKIIVTDGLTAAYPDDPQIQKEGFCSYAAFRLTDEAQNPIGLVGILHGEPIRNSWLIEAILKLFAVSMSGELERQQKAGELRQAVSLLSATLESTADGILVVDNEMNIGRYNQQFVDLWGIPPAVLHKCNEELWDHVLDQIADPAAFRQRIDELYADPAAESFDLLEFKDGRIVERFSRPQVVEGETVGRVWSFRDITERRRAEEAQRRTELELFQAQKLESLGTMAGGIAHDFNNILAGIINFVSLAQAECEAHAPQLRAYLDNVMQGSNRAKDLVQQILLFSRAEKTERTRQHCQDIVRTTLTLVRPTLPAGIDLQSQIDNDAPPVLANSTQIHQVVTNLCINAAQAIGDRVGTITLTLESRNIDEAEAVETPGLYPGPHVVLTVSDDGPGIPAENMDRVFEPFFTTKPVGLGTGLGLSVVRSIVQNHHGALQVESLPDNGCTFRVVLPAEKTNPKVTGLPDPETESGHGQRVLLVDDEKLIVHSVEILLKREGYHVNTALHPTIALERFTAQPEEFDILITDYQMPTMTGIDLATKIRAIKPDLPVIVTCGFATHIDLGALGRADITRLHTKPFEIKDLTRSLTELTG
jgi:two-component system, cell cycle sensor histidine kinase and response regulator CckA